MHYNAHYYALIADPVCVVCVSLEFEFDSLLDLELISGVRERERERVLLTKEVRWNIIVISYKS